MKTAAPEQKSVKTLKGQLFGAVAMMLVAAIALGTSTYAWFVNNQTVEVKQMDLTVSTATSLQIAVKQKGSGTYTPYKNVVATADINGTGDSQGKWDKMFDTANEYLMVPASIDNAGLAPTFADLKFYASTGHMNDAADKLDTFKALGTANTQEIGEGAVKRLPLSFLSSSDLKVFFGQKDLSTIADLVVAAASGDSINGVTLADQAEAIKSALRVAIVPQKNGDYSGSTDSVVIFQFDDGSNVSAGSGNNTDYQSVSITGMIDESAGKYAAITGIDTDTNVVSSVGQQTANVPGTTPGTGAEKYLASVADGTDGAPMVVKFFNDNTPLFELKADKPRDVDIYIWLEGTDKDCISVLSQYHFGLQLPFAGGIKSEGDRA